MGRGGSKSKWLCKPPRQLTLARSTAWSFYKSMRSLHGRNNPDVHAAWLSFNELNFQYRNFSRAKQCEYERKILSLLDTAPEVFHSYIREKNVRCPSVSPLNKAAPFSVY